MQYLRDFELFENENSTTGSEEVELAFDDQSFHRAYAKIKFTEGNPEILAPEELENSSSSGSYSDFDLQKVFDKFASVGLTVHRKEKFFDNKKADIVYKGSSTKNGFSYGGFFRVNAKKLNELLKGGKLYLEKNKKYGSIYNIKIRE